MGSPKSVRVLLLLLLCMVEEEEGVEAERQRWSEVSFKKSGLLLGLEEKAEVEKREEKGFLLLLVMVVVVLWLWTDRPGSWWRALPGVVVMGRRRPRLRLERMMLSKRRMEVWVVVVEEEVGAGGVHSRSEMNSLKADEFRRC